MGGHRLRHRRPQVQDVAPRFAERRAAHRQLAGSPADDRSSILVVALHASWVLERPAAITNQTRASLEQVVERLQRKLVDAGAQVGYHVDCLADLARVLRVPGTVNRKLPSNPRPVRMLYTDGPLLSLAGLTIEPSATATSTAPVATAIVSPTSDTTGPTADEVRARLREVRSPKRNTKTGLSANAVADICFQRSSTRRPWHTRRRHQPSRVVTRVHVPEHHR